MFIRPQAVKFYNMLPLDKDIHYCAATASAVFGKGSVRQPANILKYFAHPHLP